MVLNNFDTLFPKLTNIQPEELATPTLYELWETAMQAAIDLNIIQKYLKEYNAAKRFNHRFH